MAAIVRCVAVLLLADLSSQSPVITKEKTFQDVLFPAHLTYESCRLPPELDTWGTVAFLEDCRSLDRSGTRRSGLSQEMQVWYKEGRSGTRRAGLVQGGQVWSNLFIYQAPVFGSLLFCH